MIWIQVVGGGGFKNYLPHMSDDKANIHLHFKYIKYCDIVEGKMLKLFNGIMVLWILS